MIHDEMFDVSQTLNGLNQWHSEGRDRCSLAPGIGGRQTSGVRTLEKAT